jgi:DNA-binding NtrC family response regulator
MPARIVVVHDDIAFLGQAVAALRSCGHDVLAFDDPITAMNALEKASMIEVLVTGIRFREGRSNGVSLALTSRDKRPGVRAVFVADADHAEHARGIGELVPPADLPALLEAVTRALQRGEPSS